jgi:hypothetical protein
MKRADFGRASAALSNFDLTPSNRWLADYWLSLWSDGNAPKRADLSPAQMKHLLPGIAIFEVHAGVSVRCRLAGTAIQHALERDIAGLDWREYTHKDNWATRLERNSAIANGAVGIGIRSAQLEGGLIMSQELQLPLADETEDGARLILFHLDWRPHGTLWDDKTRPIAKVADEFHAVPIIGD